MALDGLFFARRRSRARAHQTPADGDRRARARRRSRWCCCCGASRACSTTRPSRSCSRRSPTPLALYALRRRAAGSAAPVPRLGLPAGAGALHRGQRGDRGQHAGAAAARVRDRARDPRAWVCRSTGGSRAAAIRSRREARTVHRRKRRADLALRCDHAAGRDSRTGGLPPVGHRRGLLERGSQRAVRRVRHDGVDGDLPDGSRAAHPGRRRSARGVHDPERSRRQPRPPALFATPGFEAVAGIPADSRFRSASSRRTSPTRWPSRRLALPLTGLPTDGVDSLHVGGAVATNSPTNFAGETGLVVPEPIRLCSR